MGILGGRRGGDAPEEPCVPPFIKAEQERRAREASALGLVARFSWEEFGFISIHDPTTGEWYDVPTQEAPQWAKAEAFKRKELYKAGERRLLTRAELEDAWSKERAASESVGIVDGVASTVDAKGYVYADYREED
jgi:hypothetical protein